MPVVPGGGDLEDQRLALRAGRGVELLNDVRTRVFVDLVDGGKWTLRPSIFEASAESGRNQDEVASTARLFTVRVTHARSTGLASTMRPASPNTIFA